MKISFSINYRTEWGETLYISGSIPALGSGQPDKAVAMRLIGGETWELTVDLDRSPGCFRYHYFVKRDNGSIRLEWGEPRTFVPGQAIKSYRIFDAWEDMPADFPCYSSAFADGIMMRQCPDQPLKARPESLRLRVAAPMVKPDEILAVAGSCKALGKWDPTQAVRLNDAEFPFWNANINIADLELPCEYKFLIIKKDTAEPVVWENRANRIFNTPAASPKEHIAVNGLRFANPRNDWRGAGTAVPVFSLRSDDDFGCGDFFDLKKMVEWCEKTGQRFLQTLPVNDTTKTKTRADSYPYSANSSFALHPMYVRPQAAGTLKDASRRKHFAEECARLNALPQVDYEAATALKEQYMRELYAQSGQRQMKTEEFKAFASANENWLRPYAAWRALRDRFDTPDHSQWEEYAVYDEEAILRFCTDNAEETGFFFFEQFHLDRQLREVRNFAHQHGVVLKGDIPIGVGRESVDTWKNPRLFNMDSQAGAPPDDFSVLGQNWGFPTYNWEGMSADGFSWWKERFGKMSEYFDAYRIDHILGFFRIWQIPLDAVHGLLGHFSPALPYSPEELRHTYDFWLNPEEQARPLILECMLPDFFGDHAEEAKLSFLTASGEGCYRLRPEFDTQRKVAGFFADKERDERNSLFENALLRLLDDVLFIEDPAQKGHYHPRIAAQSTHQYRILSDYEKSRFDRLYNDFFYHRHNEFWAEKALWKLPPIIFSTRMLTCAEDLGMIPGCVPEVMHRLQILSLEIPRMPKEPATEFGDTWHYPYHSVCTSSTHDMAGIRGWWESDHQRSQRYFNEILQESGTAPFFAEPWICGKILDILLKSPSMLCINPLQDWLSADGSMRRNDPREEQINDPSNPAHYWCYRMHLTLDELLAADAFNSAMRQHICASGRN